MNAVDAMPAALIREEAWKKSAIEAIDKLVAMFVAEMTAWDSRSRAKEPKALVELRKYECSAMLLREFIEKGNYAVFSVLRKEDGWSEKALDGCFHPSRDTSPHEYFHKREKAHDIYWTMRGSVRAAREAHAEGQQGPKPAELLPLLPPPLGRRRGRHRIEI